MADVATKEAPQKAPVDPRWTAFTLYIEGRLSQAEADKYGFTPLGGWQG